MNSFYSAFLNIHRTGVLTALAWQVPQESSARESQSRRVLCTPYNHAPCLFMQSHTCKVDACLAVTCHLHFWQNGRDLLRATAVTRGWNGYRNKSQHRKPTQVCGCVSGGSGQSRMSIIIIHLNDCDVALMFLLRVVFKLTSV